MRDCALEMDCSSLPVLYLQWNYSPSGGKQMKELENLECLMGFQRLWGIKQYLRTDLKTGFSPFLLS